MSPKFVLTLSTALGTAALLAACSGPSEDTEMAAEEVASAELAVTTCPEDKVLALSDYPEETLITGVAGQDWLADNAKRDDVTVSTTSLQYKVVQPGLDAGVVADPGQTIVAHYHGYFATGDKFDSSYDRGQPLVGPSNGFIKGWNEALSEMKVCEARILYIPYELAYGERGRGSIPPATPLVFRMQLLGVQ